MTPLPYQRDVARALERDHPQAFAGVRRHRPESTAELDQALLRATYRLDPVAHPAPHAGAGRAAHALGVVVPVEIYVHEDGTGRGAELLYVRDRAVIATTGATLDLLDEDEWCAVAGHELAHHVLWEAEDGRYLAASRLLDAADGDARTPAVYLETARRFRLATELYADRGAFTATGSLGPAITGLLKVTTGLRGVDVDAYLRQAAQVDLTKPSEGTTHPETVLRAWALQQWVEPGTAAEDDIAAALAPRLDLATLDLGDQAVLRDLTHAFIGAVLDEGLRTDATLELADQYDVATDSPVAMPVTRPLAPETRRYLAAVLLDFATAEEDAFGDVLARVLALARRHDLGAELEKLIGAELDLGERARTALLAHAAQINAAP